MTINIVDVTVEDGEPVELFAFKQGLKSVHFTDSIKPVQHNSETYQPASIIRDEISQSEDFAKAGLKLQFPRDNFFASQFIGFTPEHTTTVTIYRGAYPQGPFDHYWKGRVVSGKADGSVITLECESVFTSLKRPGLRARYERVCRHVLYSEGCAVNRAQYEVNDQIQTITKEVNFTMTGVVSNFSDGYFTGGLAESEDKTVRFITKHTGAVIEVARPFPRAAPGGRLKLLPGCDHIMSTCHNKFNNLDNFGGFAYIPTKNPFDGSPVA